MTAAGGADYYAPGGYPVNVYCFYAPDHRAEPLMPYYLTALATMAESARRAGIRGRLILGTVPGWEIDAGLAGRFDEIMLTPPGAPPVTDLSYLRVWAWNRFVNAPSFDAWTIAVDYDVLFVPPREIDEYPFVDDYAVGITEEPPFKAGYGQGKPNTGVLFLNPNRSAAVRSFFARFVETFERMKEQPDLRFGPGVWGPRRPYLREWGGDETVMSAMFPERALCSNGRYPHDVMLDDVAVRVFSSRWNDQPKAETGWAPAIRARGAYGNILHYAGDRKRCLFEDAAVILNLATGD